MKRVRLAVLLATFPVGCVDEDTNSATGSFVSITSASGEIAIDDADGNDGVLVDCSSLFSSNIELVEGDASVRVSFPADTPDGARLPLPDGADLSVTVGGQPLSITGGFIIVDTNDPSVDIRIAVTLEDVTTADGTVTGKLDCLETSGDSVASSCAAACAGGGGGGGDFGDD